MDAYKDFASKIAWQEFDIHLKLEGLNDASINKEIEAKKHVARKTREMKKMERMELEKLDKHLEETESIFKNGRSIGFPKLLIELSEEVIDKHIRDSKKWIGQLATGICGLIIGSAVILSAAAWGIMRGSTSFMPTGIYATLCYFVSAIIMIISLSNFAESAAIINKHMKITNSRIVIKEDMYYILQERYKNFLINAESIEAIGKLLMLLSVVPVIVLRVKADSDPALESYGGFSICAMLVILAFGILIMVNYKLMRECYEFVLYGTIWHRKFKEKKADEVLEIVVQVLFGVGVVACLLWGMVFHTWQYSWIPIVISGTLFTLSTMIYTVRTQEVPFDIPY